MSNTRVKECHLCRRYAQIECERDLSSGCGHRFCTECYYADAHECKRKVPDYA